MSSRLIFPGRAAYGPRPGRPMFNRAAPLAAGLTHWYVPVGGTVRDVLRQTPRPVTAGAYVADPRGGLALVCNGTTTRVDVGSYPAPLALSCAVWHTPTSTPPRATLMAARGPAGQGWATFTTQGGTYRADLLGATATLARTGGAVVADRPTLAVMTWDGGKTDQAIRLYAHGARIDTTNAGTGTFTGPTPGAAELTFAGEAASIGAGSPFAGTLGDLWIWDRALSAAEVATLMFDPWSLYWVPGRKLIFHIEEPVDPLHEIDLDATTIANGPFAWDAFVGGHAPGLAFEDDALDAVALADGPAGWDVFVGGHAPDLAVEDTPIDAVALADGLLSLDAFVGDNAISEGESL
jgi:hypothetical protein